jgi:hypothetical protein
VGQPFPRWRWLVRAELALVAALAGCSDQGSTQALGALVVTDSATGPVTPGPGYLHVSLGAGSPRVLWLDSSVTFADLAPGLVTLHADLLRPQCTAPLSIPVTVTSADTARVHLAISCQVIWGVLSVALPTTGPGQPSLLTVAVDGQPVGGASPNTVGLQFPFVTAGPRSIGLSGYGANCTVAEPNPQMVTVPLDDTLHVTFTLTCS